MPTKSETYKKTAELGCALCRYLQLGETPCELHHIRRGNIPRTQAPVIGLCPEHHRGNTGIHGLGRKRFEREYAVTEEELLAQTEELLNVSA